MFCTSFGSCRPRAPPAERRSIFLPSWVVARNAYPDRRPEIQVLCPRCGEIFPGTNGHDSATCRHCASRFNPHRATAQGARATCSQCNETFTILDAIARTGARPVFRLYGKLVLTVDGEKEYLPADQEDHQAYQRCSESLQRESENGNLVLPELALGDGYNTRQAMGYNFTTWRSFFNDRQLYALAQLRQAILKIKDGSARAALLTLFSGVLEFNNLFASYKGEGTGAVRHMFSHHILKPERTPIEANVWGTHKSSGSFSTLFRSRLLRALDYRSAPTEIKAGAADGQMCALPFTGKVEDRWPLDGVYRDRAIYLVSVGIRRKRD